MEKDDDSKLEIGGPPSDEIPAERASESVISGDDVAEAADQAPPKPGFAPISSSPFEISSIAPTPSSPDLPSLSIEDAMGRNRPRGMPLGKMIGIGAGAFVVLVLLIVIVLFR
jgi:hypothetical protein